MSPDLDDTALTVALGRAAVINGSTSSIRLLPTRSLLHERRRTATKTGCSSSRRRLGCRDVRLQDVSPHDGLAQFNTILRYRLLKSLESQSSQPLLYFAHSVSINFHSVSACPSSKLVILWIVWLRQVKHSP